MGNTEFENLVRGVALAMRKGNSDVRKSREAAMTTYLGSDRPIDQDDRDLLADLGTGMLSRARGDRGPAYSPRRMRRAEIVVRRRADKTGEPLAAVAELVAPRFKVPASTLINNMRRTSKSVAYLLLRRPPRR